MAADDVVLLGGDNHERQGIEDDEGAGRRWAIAMTTASLDLDAHEPEDVLGGLVADALADIPSTLRLIAGFRSLLVDELEMRARTSPPRPDLTPADPLDLLREIAVRDLVEEMEHHS